jgi:hypothetical protein
MNADQEIAGTWYLVLSSQPLPCFRTVGGCYVKLNTKY